jgi:type IV pilus assembly protein PilN
MIRVNLFKAEKKTFEDQPPGPEGEAPDKKTKEKAASKKIKTPAVNLIIVAGLVLLGALAYSQKRTLDEERALLSDAQDEQRRLQPVINKLEEIDWQKQYMVKKIALITELRIMQGTAVRVLDAMSRAIPDWVWLTEATLNKTSLQIHGRALTNVLISDYVRNLNEVGLFESVGIINTQQRAEGNNQFIEFTVSAVLPPPIPPAAPAKPKPGRTQ